MLSFILQVNLDFHFQRQGCRYRGDLDTSLTTIASSPRDPDHLQQLEDACNRSNQDRFHSNNSPLHELEGANRDGAGQEVATGPVKLLGERDDEDMEVFQLTEELDLEQIEND